MKRLINQELIDWAKSLEEYVRYDNSSNTLEVGTILYVDGKLEVNDDTIFNGNLDSYNDSALTFYEGDNNQSPNMFISPLFDGEILIFGYNDGQEIETRINLDVSEDANILTNKNVFRHQLTFLQGSGLYFAEIISSSNLKVDSLHKLTTLTKATTNYKIALFNEAGFGASDILIYNGSIWEFDIAGEEATFTSITDTITTI